MKCYSCQSKAKGSSGEDTSYITKKSKEKNTPGISISVRFYRWLLKAFRHIRIWAREMYGECGIYLKLADSVCLCHLRTPGICFSLNWEGNSNRCVYALGVIEETEKRPKRDNKYLQIHRENEEEYRD